MSKPFVYGKVAKGDNFINRTPEVQTLTRNFISGRHSIVIAPRRWGKSSLILHAAEKSIKLWPKLRIIFIDLHEVRTQRQFYEQIARETLKAFFSDADSIVNAARKYLGKYLPKIRFNDEDKNSFDLNMDLEEIQKGPDDILKLPELLAKESAQKIILCIDEFQNITHFANQKKFQKVLLTNWKDQINVSYCLSVSKTSITKPIFSSSSMPFYKFGDIVILDKISEEHWHPYINEVFSKSGLEINNEALTMITTLAENHPYYVQQLAQQSWFRTKKACTTEIVSESFDDLARQMSLLFQSIAESLSNTQIQFLRAVIKREKQLSSKKVVLNYRLGTSANVQRIKQALLEREIITTSGAKAELSDPLFHYWLQKYYFD